MSQNHTIEQRVSDMFHDIAQTYSIAEILEKDTDPLAYDLEFVLEQRNLAFIAVSELATISRIAEQELDADPTNELNLQLQRNINEGYKGMDGAFDLHRDSKGFQVSAIAGEELVKELLAKLDSSAERIIATPYLPPISEVTLGAEIDNQEDKGEHENGLTAGELRPKSILHMARDKTSEENGVNLDSLSEFRDDRTGKPLSILMRAKVS